MKAANRIRLLGFFLTLFQALALAPSARAESLKVRIFEDSKSSLGLIENLKTDDLRILQTGIIDASRFFETKLMEGNLPQAFGKPRIVEVGSVSFLAELLPLTGSTSEAGKIGSGLLKICFHSNSGPLENKCFFAFPNFGLEQTDIQIDFLTGAKFKDLDLGANLVQSTFEQHSEAVDAVLGAVELDPEARTQLETAFPQFREGVAEIWPKKTQKQIEEIRVLGKEILTELERELKDSSKGPEKVKERILKGLFTKTHDLGDVEVNLIYNTDGTSNLIIRMAHFESSYAIIIIPETLDRNSPHWKQYIARQHFDSNNYNGREIAILETEDIFQFQKHLFNPFRWTYSHRTHPFLDISLHIVEWGRATLKKTDFDTFLFGIANATLTAALDFSPKFYDLFVHGIPMEFEPYRTVFTFAMPFLIGTWISSYKNIMKRGPAWWRIAKGSVPTIIYTIGMLAMVSPDGFGALSFSSPDAAKIWSSLLISIFLQNPIKDSLYEFSRIREHLRETAKDLKVWGFRKFVKDPSKTGTLFPFKMERVIWKLSAIDNQLMYVPAFLMRLFWVSQTAQTGLLFPPAAILTVASLPILHYLRVLYADLKFRKYGPDHTAARDVLERAWKSWIWSPWGLAFKLVDNGLLVPRRWINNFSLNGTKIIPEMKQRFAQFIFGEKTSAELGFFKASIARRLRTEEPLPFFLKPEGLSGDDPSIINIVRKKIAGISNGFFGLYDFLVGPNKGKKVNEFFAGVFSRKELLEAQEKFKLPDISQIDPRCHGALRASLSL